MDISVEASSTMAGSRIASSLLKKTIEAVVEESYHLPVFDFVTEALPVEKAPEVYKNLRENPGQYRAAAFRWKG